MTPPETKITLKPPAKTHDRTPTIKFSARVSGVDLPVQLDGKPYKKCRSPFTAPRLGPGSHTFRVRARHGGDTDPSPATYRFKVFSK